MSSVEAQISDLHLGAQESLDVPKSIDALIETLQTFADRFRMTLPVTINGDLIASPCQRGDADDPRAYRYPKNWEEILRADAQPLFDYLRTEQFPVTYLMGNSERRHDMTPKMLSDRFGPNINWAERTGHHAFYDRANERLTTHMNLAEPPFRILAHSAKYIESFGIISPALARWLYARQDKTDAWTDCLQLVEILIQNAAYEGTSDAYGPLLQEGQMQRMLDEKAVEIDEDHKESCMKNETMDLRLARRAPWLRTIKDKHISKTLQSVYLRIAATMNVKYVPTKAISFGHIHAPMILCRKDIQQRLGIRPTSDSLEYIVNTGTGVPLTPAHGGNHLAHAVLWDDTGYPSLIQTYDASNLHSEPLIVNEGGKGVRRALPRVPIS